MTSVMHRSLDSFPRDAMLLVFDVPRLAAEVIHIELAAEVAAGECR